MSKYITYIGAYGAGIPVLSVDSETGVIELLDIQRGFERPTYLRASADKRQGRAAAYCVQQGRTLCLFDQ